MSLFDRLNKVKEKKQQQPETRPEVEVPTPLPGGRQVCSPMGSCILLEEGYPGTFSFPAYKDGGVQGNLRLVRGVGPVNEQKLKQQGYHSIEQLAGHARWGEYAGQVLGLLKDGKVHELKALGAEDWEILSFFKPEDVVFLDIESTGLWASQPLFLVGLLYCRSGTLVAEQYFARHYREEKAVLEAVDRVMKKYKVVVTYNGKRFDLPYMSGRSVAHRLFYSYDHFHVDLLFHARKHLKHQLPDCRLMTLEEYLMDFKREGDIPGYLIPETYHRFVKTADSTLVEPILEHNRLDLVAMARLFHLVDPGCAASLELAKEQAAVSKSSW